MHKAGSNHDHVRLTAVSGVRMLESSNLKLLSCDRGAAVAGLAEAGLRVRVLHRDEAAVLEEARVQRLNDLLLALAGYHERDVDLGGALREHLDLDTEGRKHLQYGRDSAQRWEGPVAGGFRGGAAWQWEGLAAAGVAVGRRQAPGRPRQERCSTAAHWRSV